MLETLLIYYRLLPDQNPPELPPEEIHLPPNEADEEEEEGGRDAMNHNNGAAMGQTAVGAEEKVAPTGGNNKKDEARDYDKVKEHMHMVLARYAKEGIIDYKEAAQIHDVSLQFFEKGETTLKNT